MQQSGLHTDPQLEESWLLWFTACLSSPRVPNCTARRSDCPHFTKWAHLNRQLIKKGLMLKIGGQKIPATTVVLFISDASLVIAGLFLAIVVRLHNTHSTLAYLKLDDMPLRFGWVLLSCTVALYYNDLYASKVVNRRSELFVHLLQAVGTAWVVLAILYYFIPDHSFGRGIAAMAAPTILILLLSWRLMLLETDFLLPRAQRVLVVGTGPVGISL